jgi:hypothetical protein
VQEGTRNSLRRRIVEESLQAGNDVAYANNLFDRLTGMNPLVADYVEGMARDGPQSPGNKCALAIVITAVTVHDLLASQLQADQMNRDRLLTEQPPLSSDGQGGSASEGSQDR